MGLRNRRCQNPGVAKIGLNRCGSPTLQDVNMLIFWRCTKNLSSLLRRWFSLTFMNASISTNTFQTCLKAIRRSFIEIQCIKTESPIAVTHGVESDSPKRTSFILDNKGRKGLFLGTDTPCQRRNVFLLIFTSCRKKQLFATNTIDAFFDGRKPTKCNQCILSCRRFEKTLANNQCNELI